MTETARRCELCAHEYHETLCAGDRETCPCIGVRRATDDEIDRALRTANLGMEIHPNSEHYASQARILAELMMHRHARERTRRELLRMTGASVLRVDVPRVGSEPRATPRCPYCGGRVAGLTYDEAVAWFSEPDGGHFVGDHACRVRPR